MLSADLLFDLTRFSHAALFSTDRPVWSALQGLKQYMDDYTYPGDLFAGLASGVPAAGHLVVHEDALIEADQCQIEFGDTLRGGLVISRDGKVLEGASLIMAGAVFMGAKIAIGRSVLVEGGATIKAPAIIGDGANVDQQFPSRCRAIHGQVVTRKVEVEQYYIGVSRCNCLCCLIRLSFDFQVETKRPQPLI